MIKEISEAERTYLLYLEILVKRRDPDAHLFRTFADNWFAHYAGGPFLNGRQKPKWFNNPDPFAEEDALRSMHFISARATRVLDQHSSERLVKDHSVPLRVLRLQMIGGEKMDVGAIRDFLIANYKIGLITWEEDGMLDSLGLRQSLPDDVDGPQWATRYARAAIVGEWRDAPVAAYPIRP